MLELVGGGSGAASWAIAEGVRGVAGGGAPTIGAAVGDTEGAVVVDDGVSLTADQEVSVDGAALRFTYTRNASTVAALTPIAAVMPMAARLLGFARGAASFQDASVWGELT